MTGRPGTRCAATSSSGSPTTGTPDLALLEWRSKLVEIRLGRRRRGRPSGTAAGCRAGPTRSSTRSSAAAGAVGTAVGGGMGLAA